MYVFFFFGIIILYPCDGYCLCGLIKYKYKYYKGFENISYFCRKIVNQTSCHLRSDNVHVYFKRVNEYEFTHSQTWLSLCLLEVLVL